MPILTPNEAYFLLQNQFKYVKNANLLMFAFLPIASQKIFRNSKTMEIYNQFSRFIEKNRDDISKLLKIDIKKIASLTQYENYYQYLFELIRDQLNNENKNEETVFIKNDIDIFNIFISNYDYTLIVSELSYAILCVRKSLDENEYIFLQMISMILAASGHILVLCASDYYFINSNNNPLLYSYLFNEYHIFTNYDYLIKTDKLKTVNNSYYYYYLSTVRINTNKNYLKIENPCVQIFYIAQSFDKIFNYEEQKDFPFKQIKKKYPIGNKFDINKIVIALNNCQIFKQNDVKNCWIPEKIEFKKVFINANDFINWFGGRIQCFSLLNQPSSNEYIDFNEMHYLKIDHYIQDPLLLIDIDKSTVDIVNEIKDNLENSTKIVDRIKTKSTNTTKSTKEKMQYAFHKIYKHCLSDDEKVRAHSNQIYAVHHAINYFTENNNDDSKGCIYQVHTGEGKSYIIQALAEILARMGKTVHIVTSNIVLACRDYEKSFDYFAECNFKTAILLHKTEYEKIECDNKSKYYPKSNKHDFYSDGWFDEKSNMNIKICKKTKYSKKCDIIYSTFFNFEGWYLRECEKHPMQMEDYFKDAYLIIDEADTILIDELTNGTIIAREMKSTGIDVLTKVFNLYLTDEEMNNLKQKNSPQHMNSPSKQELNMAERKKCPKQILDELKKDKSLDCSEITENDILSMLYDIDSALSFDEWTKYIIENKNGEELIIPFDGEHKGITEREKEFSGFIHQFIGIKEKMINPSRNIKIKPLSLNYLFISHPIFINLYQGVWGFTGTIGTQKDIEILKKYYKLNTVEIPDFAPNYRKELPYVICSDEKERNDKIVEEIKFFHKKGNPVLVIFESINDIRKFKHILQSEIFANIIEFDGTNQDKSNIEKKSGQKGNITLGTNFCGRGTDIKYNNDHPLHVIIAYGPQNDRAMKQAYGRTGRNGKAGTSRIICIKDDFYKASKKMNNTLIDDILNEYDIKAKRQSDFIELFRKPREWIFNSNKADLNERFNDSNIYYLRDIETNVNRLTAINYKFPICMSVETFIDIQVQKIFSLRNCPECIYTKMLFQRYLRELILESWSLFIDKVTKDYELEKKKNEPTKKNFKLFIDNQYIKLAGKLDQLLPKDKDTTVNETFVRIHSYVVGKWNKEIMNFFSKDIYDFRKTNDSKSSIFYKIGFFPFELKDKSGSRIFLTNNSKRKINFIEDPELTYLKKDEPFSITYVIDQIFERICQTIDRHLVNFFGFHIFMRRTLVGCEFGICVDPLLLDVDVQKKHCLFDKSPIFLMTIGCKSAKPFIAAILIIVLVFITLISVKIAKFLLVPGVPAADILKNMGNVIWKAVKTRCKEIIISEIVNSSPIKLLLETIIKWLQNQILHLIDNDPNNHIGTIMKIVLSLLDSKAAGDVEDKIKDKIFENIKINPEAKILFSKLTPVLLMIKIGILILLLIAAFIKNFNAKYALKQSASYQSQFDKNDKSKKIYGWYEENLTEYESYNDIKNNVGKKTSFIGDIQDN